jgi:hypothetical protein
VDDPPFPPPSEQPKPGPLSSADPKDLVAEVITAKVHLAWTDNSQDEGAFIVQRCVGAGCQDFANHIGLPGKDVTTAVDGKVKPGTTYRYRVYGPRPGIGGTGPSNVVSATP